MAKPKRKSKKHEEEVDETEAGYQPCVVEEEEKEEPYKHVAEIKESRREQQEERQ